MKIIKIIFFLTLLVFFVNSQVDPDVLANITQLIHNHGYPCTNHKVTTEDGYILQVQHVPYGRNNASRTQDPKPVVYLQHGLLDSSFTWFLNEPNEALGYILADYGFDVWAGNVRGNTMGLEHIKWTTNDVQFWNFSYDEMIQYDLPAIVDFILEETGSSEIYYVGHSQGGGMGLGALSIFPKYQEIFKSVALLAPATYENHQQCFLLSLLADMEQKYFFDFFGEKDFMPETWWIELVANTFCAADPIVCEDIILLIVGADTGNLNESRLPVFLSHTPAGSSTKNINHYLQLIRTNKWQMYDYGTDGNMVKYGQSTPPEYPVENVLNPPIGFFFGSKDLLVTQKDWEQTLARLSPDLQWTEYTVPDYDHLDYVWGVNAHTLLYPQVIQHLVSNTRK
ncbi:lipase [Anaeramoeba ignava]|uniref:Lipase n=1 Tax=Anaeramoeba ignava TaxID=1746090 RepID=A0A9Q0LHK7_ANAIG|nr:lipase [Anaeramoeba ignava]|eukprot:Anaeramoba_ignava/a478594_389.p1 GENE.a478594_389~~a478594_389.p1  ORF type:complete len:396 (-),score=138.47 a478594_389:107-1294(-)